MHERRVTAGAAYLELLGLLCCALADAQSHIQRVERIARRRLQLRKQPLFVHILQHSPDLILDGPYERGELRQV